MELYEQSNLESYGPNHICMYDSLSYLQQQEINHLCVDIRIESTEVSNIFNHTYRYVCGDSYIVNGLEVVASVHTDGHSA